MKLFLALAGVLAGVGSGQAQAQDAQAGAVVFQRCQICHQVDAAKGSGFGPNLAGVVGRRAGTLARFNYSAALAKSGIVWSSDNLDKYLAGPQKFLPGNRMAFAGLDNARERSGVIAFLAAHK